MLNPSPHPTCWICVVRILSEFQICIGWGKGELQENVEKDALFYKGTHKLQKNYECCFTFPMQVL